ncbi:MAG: rhamnogalacturonan lyase, partial [Planctomycetaceae bacterium]
MEVIVMMRRAWLGMVVAVLAADARGERRMETLDRGIAAVPMREGGVFVSWRLLATDAADVRFNVYRHDGDGDVSRVNASPLSAATSLVDTGADAETGPRYHVRAVVSGVEGPASPEVTTWRREFLEISVRLPDGYRAGDASVGDLDGDGALELVVHLVSRPRDNGTAGETGEPVLDAYEFDGTPLWRISLGKNIREGEHYTQFMVYDLDGDGRAEVACKTADGTTDGTGAMIGDATADWRTRQPGSSKDGRILEGPEFLTVFAGDTGAALATVDDVPGRDPIDGWGGIGGNAGNDAYGNRCDRFLACVAHLDGERPSLVTCRGVYGRTVLVAWDWRDGRLTRRWLFDSGISMPPFDDASPYSGMGGHSLAVGDVDDDGRDEIVYQAMVVDDDGRGLYTTGLRHGDAMHLADIDPDRDGQEVFTVQENEEEVERFQTPGAALRDAATGEILWSHSPMVDVPAGLVADIDPRHRGCEVWGGPGGLRDARGREIGPAPREADWCIWWDGDPLRELLTPGRDWARGFRQWPPGGRGDVGPGSRRGVTRISKWDPAAGDADTVFECDAVGVSRGPALLGDLLGDWREEVLLVSPDGGSLRLYTTTIPTNLRMPTLLHDPQ